MSSEPRERTLPANGVRLVVREWPEPGPALLLLHGLASTSHIWDLVAPMLAGSFHVVAYDQRGHGRSGKPSSGYGFASMTADAAAVIRGLRLRRPVVVGHSWGANVALELGVGRPRLVAGAVLVDGGFVSLRDRMDWPTARERLAPPPISGMPLARFRSGFRSLVGDSLELTPEIEAVFLSLMRVDARDRIHPRLSRSNHLRILRSLWEQDAPGLLRRVTVPTLVLAVRSSPRSAEEASFVRAREEAARDVRAIGDPVRFAWIDGIHDVPLQRPDAVARRIARFARTAVG